MRTGWMNNPHLLIDKEPAIIHDKGMHQRWREECAERIEAVRGSLAPRNRPPSAHTLRSATPGPP